MIGELVGTRYRILRELGEGAVGQVYLAEHCALGRHEALKVLKPAVAVDPQFVSRFRRESRAINRLQHANVVSVYDFGRLPDGRMFLSMEYAEGTRLDQLIANEGPQPLGRSMHIASQLSRAVDHAHSRGVVHRDLKPSNLILVEHRGHPDVLKVLDFGMAKIIAPEYAEQAVVTLKGQTFGTPAYMAPEQFTEPGSDPRTDIYAIGCILFEMLVGEPPFPGRGIDLMHRHRTEAPSVPSERCPDMGFPPELDAAIARCLAKTPDERYQRARELLADLQRVPGYYSGRARPKMRKSRLGVAMPVSLEEEESTHSHSFDSHFHDRLATAETEVLTIEDLERDWEKSLLELAEALIDAGASHHALSVGVARVHGVVHDSTRCESEQNELRRRESGVEQRAREREGSLRFAIGELKFDREQCAAEQREELDLQLDALESRLLAALADTNKELVQLTDRGIELAGMRAELDEESDDIYALLGSTVDVMVPQWQDNLAVAPVLDRYQSISDSLNHYRERLKSTSD